MKILYLENYVQIPDTALTPLVGENWHTVNRTFTKNQYSNLPSGWLIDLPSPIKSSEKLKVKIFIQALAQV